MPRPRKQYEEEADDDEDDEYERDDVRAENAGASEDEDGDEQVEDRGGRSGRRRRRDDDDGDHEGGHRSKSKKKKSRKVKVMEESGQTDEDRRLLRQAQRELQRQIATGEDGEKMEDPDSEAFARIRDENNELWDGVRFTREAVLDGDNLELISRRAARQVDKLVQVPRYDAVRFSQKLRAKLTKKAGSTTYFDWKALGTECGACFNATPSRVSFLNGPIDVVYVPKERKKREKRQEEEEEEDEEEEQPEELRQKKQKADGDKLSAVEKNIKDLSKVLKKRTKEAMEESNARIAALPDSMNKEEKKREAKRIKKNGGNEVDGVRLMFNPQSFTQTVENIFHFAFLVKKGDAGIRARTAEESAKYDGGLGPGPVVQRREPPSHDTVIEAKQAIVSLNMQDWRDMCAAYQVEESDVPHRKSSKRAKAGK